MPVVRLMLAAAVTVSAGQVCAQHWSFRELPERVALPDVASPGWCRNDLDRFVLARLEAEGLEPSPPAERRVWLRRAALTLTGLPPERADYERFESDGEPGAFGRAADRLLASPRYAERMASEWLDVARYADTYGYQHDVERPVWPWRDWVVGAFADNLPFDRFVTWQVAGDLLPDATREQRLATAFQRLHRQTNEGGSVEEEMRLEYVADRTETFATAFLGSTMNCARCHDHKFDPITIREYYALSAFFDDVDESGLYSHFTHSTPTPAMSLATDEQQQMRAQAAAQVAKLEVELQDLESRPNPGFERALAGGTVAVAPPVASFSFDEVDGQVLQNGVDVGQDGFLFRDTERVEGRAGRALRFSGDNGARLSKVGEFGRHQPFSFAFWLRVPEAYERAIVLSRSKAWTDAGSRGYEVLIEHGELSFALVHFWPGNAIRVRTAEPLPIDTWVHVAVSYDGSSRADGLTIRLDGHDVATTVVRDGLTREITGGGAGALALAERFRDRGLAGGCIDELLVYDRELTAWEAATLAGGAPRADQLDARLAHLRTVDDGYRGKLRELTAARRALARVLDAEPEIMVMRDMAEPRPTHVRTRGAYDRPGEVVEPDTPACLPPLPDGPKDRLTLARWLCAPDHPLTARVAVNRIWQMHFGRGLVVTAEDFGTQGEPPSHPQLLDWLARWFVASGWDTKALHRLIVTSATFGQSSRATPELRRRDPDNVLLARGPRYQLAAEVLRDQALWSGELLVETRGGPPVMPYQPAGLWHEKSGIVYRPSTGDGLYRRSLYTFWKRTSPPPAMMLLDASKRDVCAMRRQRTTTPLQALLMMNDPQFVEAARVFAERLVAAGHGDELPAAALRRLVGREPDEREQRVLGQALREHRREFAEHPERAVELLAVGERRAAAGLDPVEVAAATMVVQTILNLDEVVRLR